MIKIGLVGRGTFACEHLRVLQKIRGAEVVGIYSQNILETERIARCFGTRCFDQFQSLLEHPEIEVIDVVTSHDRQVDCAREALKAGKNISISKPIALSLNEARGLIHLADSLGKKIVRRLQ